MMTAREKPKGSMFERDQDCVSQRRFVNIPAWHEAGFKGKGLTVFCDDIGGNHVDCVADIIRVILPEATILTGCINYTEGYSNVKDCGVFCEQTGRLHQFDDFVRQYQVRLINNSKTGGRGVPGSPIANYMAMKIENYNMIMTASAGNVNGGEIDNAFYGAAIVVNSAIIRKGIPRHSHCAIGEGIDFCMFNGFQPGTSFAAPFLLGMAGLLCGKYPGITQKQVYQYFVDHCRTVEHKGKNIYTGHGMPVLGDPLNESEG